ncbi:polymorphic toxin-type HINT domain-containing protein [Streptomyces amakusaensis]|uniref:Polymorphic toxin-type HINT domain-containing protein n=1 Tax=Streptomyces amakusaensis TaxID=67271 RepID=A0ABW0AGA8_9ACTN
MNLPAVPNFLVLQTESSASLLKPFSLSSASGKSLTATLAATAPFTNTVTNDATAYHQSFTFDRLGNRATLTDHSPASPGDKVSHTYAYGKATGNGTAPADISQPHTLTSVTSVPAGKESTYDYDATGNTTTRDFPGTAQDQALKWTPENRLDTITENGVKITYVYDAEGNRILENSPTGSTLYLGETELATDATGKITRASRGYAHPGAPSVIRTTDNGSTTSHKLSALITDQAGTANTTIDLGPGQPITRRAFTPYGELRGPKPSKWPNKRTYLGVGIDDETTGLTHIGAREYDQKAGRFISADPIIDIADPLQMNGYAYSNNSPISKSDPTGLINADVGSGGTVSREQLVALYADINHGYGMSKKEANWKAWQDYAKHHTPQRVQRTYCTALPGMLIAKSYPGAKKYVQFVQKEARDRDFWYNGSPNPALPTYQMELASLHMNACHETGVCPGGKAKAASAEAAAGMMGLAGAGGRGRTPGRAKRSDDCDPNSFLPGTKVLMADGTAKPIEDVKIGDKVLATDPETGETAPKTVTAELFNEGSKNLVKVSLDVDGKGSAPLASITATEGHPFWVPELGEWINATELQAGQWLKTSAGTHVQITAVERWTQRAAVHNLTVVDIHTYYVLAGATPVLVHNCGGGTIDPKLVRFSQDTVSPRFGSGETIEQTAAALRSGYLEASDLPTVRLTVKGGKIHSLDNRRLVAFQKAGIPMPFRMATPEEAASEAWKFTTKNEGRSILINYFDPVEWMP